MSKLVLQLGLLAAVVVVGCTGSGSENGTPATTTSSSVGGAAGSAGDGGSGAVGGWSLGGSGAGGFVPTPVRALPNLASITFYERTGGVAPNPYTFTVDGPELTVRLPDPLSEASHDIPGATSEYYDVYYSNLDGSFALDGSYLTISGVFLQALPAGGGLNLAEIALNFDGLPPEYGNWVASYVALGDNKDESSVNNCIDGDLQTHTTMGNTVGSSERLRLTLGFESTSGPPR
jgi:hypothetical protein